MSAQPRFILTAAEPSAAALLDSLADLQEARGEGEKAIKTRRHAQAVRDWQLARGVASEPVPWFTHVRQQHRVRDSLWHWAWRCVLRWWRPGPGILWEDYHGTPLTGRRALRAERRTVYVIEQKKPLPNPPIHILF